MTAPEVSRAVRIPADVEREDRILAGLTARQVALLATVAVLLYGMYAAVHRVVPVAVLLAVLLPVAVLATVLVIGSRDGLSLDRLLVAAVRQRGAPRIQVDAPEGITSPPVWLTDVSRGSAGAIPSAGLQLPIEQVTPAAANDLGVVDLGADGLAVVCVASTVNFALQTPGEQEALVAAFGRYLHSLTAPVQILIRTHRLDLTTQVAELRERAGGLPHPALEAAALEHADFLQDLAAQSDLLRRQVLLVLHEHIPIAAASSLSLLSRRRRRHAGSVSEGVRRAAETRLVRRVSEAVQLLAAAGITLISLDVDQASAVLTAACNPDSLLPTNAVLAGADEVITTAAESLDDDGLLPASSPNVMSESDDVDGATGEDGVWWLS